jgi:hypothetical protein
VQFVAFKSPHPIFGGEWLMTGERRFEPLLNARRGLYRHFTIEAIRKV